MIALKSTSDDVDAGFTSVLLADAPWEQSGANLDGFAIDCEEHANWLVRKVVNARQYAQKVKEWAERERRRAEREEQTLLFLFGRQLESWAKEEVEKLNGRRKSLCLPAGTVAFRTVGARLVVDIDESVLAWAREHCPKAVVTEVLKKLSKTELKAHFEATGEMPDAGAHIEPEHEQFSIS